MAVTIEQWIKRFDTDFGFLPTAMAEPTEARPGSQEKIEVLQARIAAGLAVHAVGDHTLQDSCRHYAAAELSDSCWIGSVQKGSEQSRDGRYVYRVRRIWEPSLPVVCVVGLCPPIKRQGMLKTIRQQVAPWGCGGLELVNLFALRCDDPLKLETSDDPIGPVNDRSIRLAIEGATYVVCAWGDHGVIMARSAYVLWALSQSVPKARMYCLGLTRTLASALDEDKVFSQPAAFMDVHQPWVPRLLPMGLMEQERILRG